MVNEPEFTAIPDGSRTAADPAAHRGQDDGTRGGASAGETTESDGGLSALATSTEENRRTRGRGEMLARLSALPATGTRAGLRRSLSDGVVAQSEAAEHPAPHSGLGPLR